MDLLAHGVADLQLLGNSVVDGSEVYGINAGHVKDLVDVVGKLKVLVHRDDQRIPVLLLDVGVPVKVVVAKAGSAHIGLAAATAQRCKLCALHTAACHFGRLAVGDHNAVCAPFQYLTDGHFVVVCHAHQHRNIMQLCSHDLLFECFIQHIVGVLQIQIDKIQTGHGNVFDHAGRAGKARHTENRALFHLFLQSQFLHLLFFLGFLL